MKMARVVRKALAFNGLVKQAYVPATDRDYSDKDSSQPSLYCAAGLAKIDLNAEVIADLLLSRSGPR